MRAFFPSTSDSHFSSLVSVEMYVLSLKNVNTLTMFHTTNTGITRLVPCIEVV